MSFSTATARSRQLRITFGLRVSDQSSHLHGDQTPIATPEFFGDLPVHLTANQ
jgi:hypothetical protein